MQHGTTISWTDEYQLSELTGRVLSPFTHSLETVGKSIKKAGGATVYHMRQGASSTLSHMWLGEGITLSVCAVNQAQNPARKTLLVKRSEKPLPGSSGTILIAASAEPTSPLHQVKRTACGLSCR